MWPYTMAQMASEAWVFFDRPALRGSLRVLLFWLFRRGLNMSSIQMQSGYVDFDISEIVGPVLMSSC